jgi:hypothetical protein
LLSVLLSVFLGKVLGLGGVGGDTRLADDLLGEDFRALLAALASVARFCSCACAWALILFHTLSDISFHNANCS